MKSVLVSIVMGSDSDMPIMQEAAKMLDQFGIGYEIDVISAHRTPERALEFGKNAHKRGVKIIIAGAGGAAHLPGVMAGLSPLPIIGVPLRSQLSIDGWDSVLSILQMPSGIPVATVALDGAKNAGILAAQMLSTGDESMLEKILAHKKSLADAVIEKSSKLYQTNVKG
jgi:5-(carboxyamino)imidazole ribonucleotide mutase